MQLQFGVQKASAPMENVLQQTDPFFLKALRLGKRKEVQKCRLNGRLAAGSMHGGMHRKHLFSAQVRRADIWLDNAKVSISDPAKGKDALREGGAEFELIPYTKVMS